jgi:hypothetical protein|tara:strand:+ start:155 stop:280 length:126 start_codon:yes stop_codon:yes gene_type:complete
MTEADKAPFQKLADADKERYTKQQAAYLKSDGYTAWQEAHP